MKDLMSKLAGKPDEQSDTHAQAKMQVLQELRDMAMGMMGDKMKGQMPGDDEMHGVEVMAPDKDGLKKGLDLAQSALPSDDEASEGEAPGLPDADEGDELDDMSPEEIDAMIEELQARKQQAQMKA